MIDNDSNDTDGGVSSGESSRRNWLGALGAVGLGGLLAACEGASSGIDSDDSAASSAAALSMAGLEYVNTVYGDLRAYNPSLIPDAVLVLGYYVPGDGGGGLFQWNALSTALDNGGTIITPTWVGSGSGRWVRQFEHSVSVRWFGAFASAGSPGATGYSGPTVGNLQAFTNAIRCLTPDSTPTYHGPRVLVPPGRYQFTETLVIDRSVTVIGAGGHGSISASWLVFPADQDGIRVYRNLPPPVPPPSPPLHQRPRGDWSIIEGLQITGGLGTSGHGIVLNAKCSLRDCSVSSFAGNGVHADCSVSASNTNANSWHMQDVRVYQCFHGFYFDGSDANAGVGIGLNASNNRGWGIYDSSFLGNTFVGCHTATNVLGSYKTDNSNARSVFLGCYAEIDQDPASVQAPSLVLGGMMNTSGTGGFLGEGAGASVLRRGELRVENELNSARAVRVTLGSPNVGDTAMELKLSTEPQSWRLRFEGPNSPGYADRTGWWDLEFAELTVGSALRFCGQQAAEWLKGYGGAKAWFLNGYYVGRGIPGGGAGARVLTVTGSQPPTTGTWTRGDRVLNTTPTPGSWAGWICISGSDVNFPQGQWKGFGAIEL